MKVFDASKNSGDIKIAERVRCTLAHSDKRRLNSCLSTLLFHHPDS
jgi:hypothetical protein